MRQTLTQELGNLIERGRDRQLRLAVTGLSRAGKTAFLTSLVNQLRHAGLEARLDLMPAAREGRLLGARRVSQPRSEEHTSELQSRGHLVCRLLLEKKKLKKTLA